MKALGIANSATVALELQDEIRRSAESRYDHRLHGVLLVAQGMTCPEVADLLGDAPRSVENWVRRFGAGGLAGLEEGGRSGRPRRLSVLQLAELEAVLGKKPREADLGGDLWDGKTVAAWIHRQYGILVGVRQCQRLLRQLGFRIPKLRAIVVEAGSGTANGGQGRIQVLTEDRAVVL